MAESNLRTAFFYGCAVENPTAQARADRAVSLSFRHEPLDHGVGVALYDAMRDAAAFKIFRQDVGGEARLLLV
jgi:hypothetical protein